MKNTIGVDVSKDRLDVCACAGELHRQFSNDRRGIGDLVRWIEELGPPLVVFEATGAYHRALEAGLGAKGLVFCKVNPRQSRRFAEATGRLAKTDRVDAATLARMGAVLDLPARPPSTEILLQLKELLAARRALIKDQVAAKTRARTAEQTIVRRQIAARLRLIKTQIAEIDRAILGTINADPDLTARMAILTSIPGIATVTAVTLLIDMPELGTLSNKQAASLAGLAPVSRQSGKWQGKERIRGGRGELRARSTCPHSPQFASTKTSARRPKHSLQRGSPRNSSSRRSCETWSCSPTRSSRTGGNGPLVTLDEHGYCAGSSSRLRSPASRSRSTRGSTTGNEAGGDICRSSSEAPDKLRVDVGARAHTACRISIACRWPHRL